ncbi:Transposase [Shigella dysenteriae 1617]|uniref:Transposase n=25 Tax=Enterobacterales TaxID=91347 RepID=A0A0A6ZQN3_SHIDY|nr:Transposase [Shigella dysenteriae 1617]
MKRCVRVPGVSRSGYYDRVQHEPSGSGYYDRVQHAPSDRKQSDERLKLEIKVAHIRTRETYGTRRLQTELEDNGIIVGRDRLARLRKELRLHCKQKRKFRATTNSDHNLPVTPNLLNQNFTPTAPNQVWVADITYVATREGWLYLAGVKDVYTCEIVGYAMGERMTKELTGKALFMALRSQRPPAGLIHHTDRGSQYCAYDYRVIQEQSGLKTSMSRKGNCYDNAPMESFWGTLKNESLSHYRFKSRDEAISVIREYIEIFYNRQSGKNIIRWLLKKRTNGSVRYCQYTSHDDRDQAVPYTATADDVASTGQQIWQELQSGKWGEIAPFTVTPEMLEAAREARRQGIEAWRTEQEAKPFTFEWNGRIWNAGPNSLGRPVPGGHAGKICRGTNKYDVE